jgi:hypothetical protein
MRFIKNNYKGGDYIVIRKIKFSILIVVLLTFCIFAGLSISIFAEETGSKKETKQEAIQQKEKSNPYANAEIITKIMPSANKTFGYEILVNGKTLVRQPNIPSLSGNEGFATKKKAQKVADFVVKKIRKNEMPPTVTMNDLKSMNVLKKD